MNKMKNFVFINCLMIVTFFVSCDSEDAEPDTPLNPDTPVNINFDLSDAQAIVFQEAGAANGRTATSESTNLFKVDSDGNVSSVIDSIEVTLARTFSQGLYVEISDGQTLNIRRFYVLLDNSYEEIEDEIGGKYKGENENGDLIFSDVSILRANSLAVEKLQTTLDFPTVQSISGNLAIIRDNAIFQIFNTVTNIRYNVNGCNGPRIEAFNGSSKAIINDCSDEILIDMNDGSRTEVGNLRSWNNESLRVSDGIVVLSQGISVGSDLNDFGLGHIDQNGNFTILTDNVFQPGASVCSNCGDPNSVLFGTDQYLIVRELNKISVVDRSNDNAINSILNGFNVTKMSLEGNLIYYLAEDNMGNPITGIYNITNEENQILDNQTMYDDIQTF